MDREARLTAIGQHWRRVYAEFDHIGDFIWKSVRLLEHETRIELAKLDAYFPTDSPNRDARWAIESHKLEAAFPYMIATANLYLVTASLEQDLLLLATDVDATAALAGIRRHGMSRFEEFFAGLGAPLPRAPCWEQVSFAFAVRNCMLHAAGALSHSREAERLRRGVVERRYIVPSRRRRILARSPEHADILLVTHPTLGERLELKNDYPWSLAALFRDFFLDLAEAVGKTIDPEFSIPEPRLS